MSEQSCEAITNISYNNLPERLKKTPVGHVFYYSPSELREIADIVESGFSLCFICNDIKTTAKIDNELINFADLYIQLMYSKYNNIYACSNCIKKLELKRNEIIELTEKANEGHLYSSHWYNFVNDSLSVTLNSGWSRKNETSGHVYFVKGNQKIGTKIGCTNQNVLLRIAQQGLSKENAILKISTPKKFWLEHFLHKRFRDKHMFGEVFALDDSDMEFVTTLKTLDNKNLVIDDFYRPL